MAKQKEEESKQENNKYFLERMNELGVDPEKYVFRQPVRKDNQHNGKIIDWKEHPVFELTPEGHIKINYYNHIGQPERYRKNGTSKQLYEYYQLRLLPGTEIKGKPRRYDMPANVGTRPFLPPNLIQKVLDKTEIETLVLTEGAFKAVKGDLHGLDIIGISSITTFKDHQVSELHLAIQEVLKICKVKNVIWLHDGDARELKPGSFVPPDNIEKDLYLRPKGFFATVTNIRELIRKFQDISIYYAVVDASKVECEGGKPKGLDDLYIALQKNAPDPAKVGADVTADLLKVGHDTQIWFKKFYITYAVEEVRKWFGIDKAESFYKLHEARLKEHPFVYNGTKYKWQADEGVLEVVVPREAKNFFRVGTEYYHKGRKARANPREGSDLILEKWNKSTIIDDFGKDFLRHVRKLFTFSIRPDHINYQEIIDGNYNTYHPFAWTKLQEGSWANIKKYLKHVFGTNTITYTHPKTKKELTVNELDLALDYVQLLYEKPTQKLPILCLVSKEKETGKSTFLELLKHIFTDNAIFVSNSDLESDFNAFWLSKLLVMSNEVFIDKKRQGEMLKNFSTSSRATANGKNVGQREEEVFMKFVFTSNDEDKFILTDEEEKRYWVRKVPKLTAEELNPHLLEDMIKEIPAFLNYLSQRSLATDECNRMWFHTPLIQTDALRHVISHNKSTVHKEISEYIEEMFYMTGVDELLMTPKVVKEQVFGKSSKPELNYIRKVLKDELKLELWTNENGQEGKRYEYPVFIKREGEKGHYLEEQWHQDKGRCYIFPRSAFIKASITINPDLINDSTANVAGDPNRVMAQGNLPYRDNDGDSDTNDTDNDMPF